MGKGNRKAGVLELEMGCLFDPDITMRELGEETINKIRKSEMENCPGEKMGKK
jgi:hypothetical protein